MLFLSFQEYDVLGSLMKDKVFIFVHVPFADIVRLRHDALLDKNVAAQRGGGGGRAALGAGVMQDCSAEPYAAHSVQFRT